MVGQAWLLDTHTSKEESKHLANTHNFFLKLLLKSEWVWRTSRKDQYLYVITHSVVKHCEKMQKNQEMDFF